MAQPQYATVTELALVMDEDLLSQLASDSRTPVERPVSDSNAIAVNALKRASADVESSALRGGRYTVDELAEMQADDNWSLKGLVCKRAVYHLVTRRAGGVPDAVRDIIKDANDSLALLRTGEEILQVIRAQSAGRPDINVITQTQRSQLGLVSDSAFFPLSQTQEY